MFVDTICEYVSDDKNMLNHIDLSGMDFSKDSLFTLCKALSLNDTYLMGIHLNDNGIRYDNEYMMEILELFMLDIQEDHIHKKAHEFDHTLNGKIQQSKVLKEILKENTGKITAVDIKTNQPKVNLDTYMDHLMHTK